MNTETEPTRARSSEDHFAAHVLRDAATSMCDADDVRWLLARADDLDGGESR